VLRAVLVEREGNDVVDIIQAELNISGDVYSYCSTFSTDDEEVRTRHSIFDNARRVWMFGKLIYSIFPQDFINHDRSLPMVIDTESAAQPSDV
jgi:hypothetical protein